MLLETMIRPNAIKILPVAGVSPHINYSVLGIGDGFIHGPQMSLSGGTPCVADENNDKGD